MKPLLLLLSLYVLLAASACQTINGFSTDLTASDGNPLRGFYSYIGSVESTEVPTSIEYEYISVRDVVVGEEQYDFSPIEDLIEEAVSRNRQFAFRLYLDYPGTPPTGLPAYLDGTVSLTSYSNYGGGQSPDYSHVLLKQMLSDLINELGAEYDGDPRIAFIEVGLLGFWGEWHTYPRTELEPPEVTRDLVATAFDNAFDETLLMVSADELGYTGESPDISAMGIGWHDDDFGASTCNGEDYSFQDRLAVDGSANHVNDVMFGGEVQPDVQNQVFRNDGNAAEFQACVDAIKTSTLLDYSLFTSAFSSSHKERAIEIYRTMGYQYAITSVGVDSDTCTCPDCVGCASLAVRITNAGNAPFYYPLTLYASIGEQYFSTTVDPIIGGSSGTTTVTVGWKSADISAGNVPVRLFLYSSNVLPSIRIRWANTNNDAIGAQIVQIPTSCGGVGSSTGSATSGPPVLPPTRRYIYLDSLESGVIDKSWARSYDLDKYNRRIADGEASILLRIRRNRDENAPNDAIFLECTDLCLDPAVYSNLHVSVHGGRSRKTKSIEIHLAKDGNVVATLDVSSQFQQMVWNEVVIDLSGLQEAVNGIIIQASTPDRIPPVWIDNIFLEPISAPSKRGFHYQLEVKSSAGVLSFSSGVVALLLAIFIL